MVKYARKEINSVRRERMKQRTHKIIAIGCWTLGIINIALIVFSIMIKGFTLWKIPLGIMMIILGFIWWNWPEF